MLHVLQGLCYLCYATELKGCCGVPWLPTSRRSARHWRERKTLAAREHKQLRVKIELIFVTDSDHYYPSDEHPFWRVQLEAKYRIIVARLSLNYCKTLFWETSIYDFITSEKKINCKMSTMFMLKNGVCRYGICIY